ncbi:hydroxyacylglutathione hydrolase [Neisseriaceae bacterium ESL0693]|nr:hydroxyacylglutathione hydrolase [Neisseriaceae bacterium ESL0693]
MHITAVPAFRDNYIWLLQVADQVVAVDPGEASPLLAFLNRQGLNLNAIWLTHAHADHIGGVAALKQHFPACQVYGAANWSGVNQTVTEGSQISLAPVQVSVWQIAGHTSDHLAYLVKDQQQQLHVFCGDTLFSAGCGRVFTGTLAQLYHSIQRLNQLPANTLFYPAHEYTAANLRFAHTVEPDNAAINQALAEKQHLPTLPVTLAHERKINPFLRLDQPSLQKGLIKAGLTPDKASQPLQAFAFLRHWKDQF